MRWPFLSFTRGSETTSIRLGPCVKLEEKSTHPDFFLTQSPLVVLSFVTHILFGVSASHCPHRPVRAVPDLCSLCSVSPACCQTRLSCLAPLDRWSPFSDPHVSNTWLCPSRSQTPRHEDALLITFPFPPPPPSPCREQSTYLSFLLHPMNGKYLTTVISTI